MPDGGHYYLHMLAIPSLSDAPRAWAALPEDVRAEARQYAERFEGHPDPAAAAVVVGQIRADADRKWRRDLIAVTAFAVFLGAEIAYLGELDDDVLLYPWVLAVGVVAMVVMATALRRPLKRSIPHRAEAANLRVFLSAETATAVRDPDRLRRQASRIAVIAAVLAGVTASVWWLTSRIFGLAFDPTFIVEDLRTTACAVTVVYGIVLVLQNVHRPKYWAKQVSVSEDGVRFGRPSLHPWVPVVAWADVVDVTLDGPTAQRPHNDAATVWLLRDGTAVRVVLAGSRQPPEEQILSARNRRVQVC